MRHLQIPFMIFYSLLASNAVAQEGSSRLQVSMSKPVGLMVDGQMYEMQEQSLTYIVDNLTEGRHEISLRSMFGKELDNLFIDVPAHSEMRCRYRKKIFECYDTVALAPVVQPDTVLAVAPPSSVVVETTTTTTTTEHLGDLPGEMLAGGITLSGPDGETVSVGMNVGSMGAGVSMAGPDGEVVNMDINMGSMGAGVSMSGPDGDVVNMDVTLGDMSGDMAMGGTFTETTTVTTTTEPVHVVHPPVYEEPVRVAPSHTTLVFRSTDGEWADVVINGKVMAEFRNEDEISVRVKSGKHTVEIREFMNDKSYTRAKIHTGYADEVVVGITEGQPIECYNHEGCY